jgi:hypothetical protein
MSATIDLTATQAQRVYEFEANLERWQQQLDDRIAEAYRNIIFVFLMNIVVGGLYSPGTPVRTGFARNSWVVGINGPGEPRQASQPDAAARKQQVAVIDRGRPHADPRRQAGRRRALDLELRLHGAARGRALRPGADGHDLARARGRAADRRSGVPGDALVSPLTVTTDRVQTDVRNALRSCSAASCSCR